MPQSSPSTVDASSKASSHGGSSPGPDTEPAQAAGVAAAHTPAEPRDTPVVIAHTPVHTGADASTLLSVPAPASSYEVEVEERLTRLERSVSRLTGRVESLELKGSQPNPARPGQLRLWLLLVLTLVVVVSFLIWNQ